MYKHSDVDPVIINLLSVKDKKIFLDCDSPYPLNSFVWSDTPQKGGFWSDLNDLYATKRVAELKEFFIKHGLEELKNTDYELW